MTRREWSALAWGLWWGALFALAVAWELWPAAVSPCSCVDVDVTPAWREAALECAEVAGCLQEQMSACCGVAREEVTR